MQGITKTIELAVLLDTMVGQRQGDNWLVLDLELPGPDADEAARAKFCNLLGATIGPQLWPEPKKTRANTTDDDALRKALKAGKGKLDATLLRAVPGVGGKRADRLMKKAHDEGFVDDRGVVMAKGLEFCG